MKKKPKSGTAEAVRPGDPRNRTEDGANPRSDGSAAPAADAREALKRHPFLRDTRDRWIPRSSIIKATYNPRQIDLNAKIKLKEGLREYGLVEPLVWNERTGNLVGGHQRITVMDEEVNFPASGEDYSVLVCVVDLSPSDEKTLNVLLNNPGAQGWWDWQGLKELAAGDKGFDPELAGFDKIFLKANFDAFTAPDDGLDLSHIFGAQEEDPAKADADAIAKMKATKEDFKASEGEMNREGFYLMVVGRTVGEKEMFCRALGLSDFTKNVELRDVYQRINKLVERGETIDIGWTPPPDPQTESKSESPGDRPDSGAAEPDAGKGGVS